MSEAANAPAPEIQIIETREGRILRLQEEGQTMDLAVLWDATLGMVAPAISEADLAGKLGLKRSRDTLCGFGPGSLLLLDYPHVFGESEDEIQRRDPWLQQQDQALRWQGAVASFLAGPLRRYCPDAEKVELRAQRTTGGLSIPGSYAIEVIATVHGRPDPRRAAPQPPPRRFSVFRLKRYVPAQVIAALKERGWEHVSGLAYGQDVGYVRTMSLFRREGGAGGLAG